MNSKIHILLPAAGIGSRFGTEHGKPKQYMPFGDSLLIDHSLNQLMSLCLNGQVIVGIAEEDIWWPTTSASKLPEVLSVKGGASRARTVTNMLAAIDGATEHDWVLVHDAVRPCISKESLASLISELETTEASGISLGKPVYEAVKRVSDKSLVLSSENRDGLWTTQTPQVFRYAALKASLDACLQQNLSFDDEMMALHHLGYKTAMLEGSAWNIKITKAQDLPLAKQYWQIMQNS